MIKIDIKVMLAGLVIVWIVAFLLLAFFSPWAAKLASASSDGGYQCFGLTGISNMPIDINDSSPGVWVPGYGGSGAVMHCSNFVSKEDLPITMQPNPTSIACGMIVFSVLDGGSYETDMAHNGSELFMQVPATEDIFVLECYWIYNF